MKTEARPLPGVHPDEPVAQEFEFTDFQGPCLESPLRKIALAVNIDWYIQLNLFVSINLCPILFFEGARQLTGAKAQAGFF